MKNLYDDVSREVPLQDVTTTTTIPLVRREYMNITSKLMMSEQNIHTHQLLMDHTNSSMIMIILSGIPGSGKSTFARRLVDALPELYQHQWDIHNQDVLGSRKKVEESTIASLRSKRCVIIDRCNFDSKQRKTWIDLGYHYHVHLIISVVLPDYDNVAVCSLRAFDRGNDGIHEEDVNWNMVCHIMKGNFRLPTLKEGMNCIYQCRNESDMISLIEEFRLIANK